MPPQRQSGEQFDDVVEIGKGFFVAPQLSKHVAAIDQRFDKIRLHGNGRVEALERFIDPIEPEEQQSVVQPGVCRMRVHAEGCRNQPLRLGQLSRLIAYQSERMQRLEILRRGAQDLPINFRGFFQLTRSLQAKGSLQIRLGHPQSSIKVGCAAPGRTYVKPSRPVTREGPDKSYE